MNPPPGEEAMAWRVTTLEKAYDKLDVEKADVKDVQRLADEFKSLRLTLQWFMGIVAAAVVAFAVIVMQVAAS